MQTSSLKNRKNFINKRKYIAFAGGFVVVALLSCSSSSFSAS